MNILKIKLKAVVMTQLLQALQSQGKALEGKALALVHKFQNEVVAATELHGDALDSTIEDDAHKLIATIDAIPEDAKTEAEKAPAEAEAVAEDIKVEIAKA